jgi:hypothetical protein
MLQQPSVLIASTIASQRYYQIKPKWRPRKGELNCIKRFRLYFVKKYVMAERIRNPDWQEDDNLKDDLQCYVVENFRRKEILDFVERDYPQYAWSLGTLDRRLAHFCIKFINYDADIDEVEAAVREETNGPGQLLGYRAMHRKIREQHNLAVPRDLVYDMMTLVDPEGLERHGNVGKRKRHRGPTGTFTSMVFK